MKSLERSPKARLNRGRNERETERNDESSVRSFDFCFSVLLSQTERNIKAVNNAREGEMPKRQIRLRLGDVPDFFGHVGSSKSTKTDEIRMCLYSRNISA